MITFNKKNDDNNIADWNLSADSYNEYATHHKLYCDCANYMTELADLKPGMSVLDLGCGTGISIEAILNKLPGHEDTVIGIDFSPVMLAYAKSRFTSKGVTFYCHEAENLCEVISSKIDRIICNAAFWQFNMEKTFAAISQVLKPSGRCLISLPALPQLTFKSTSQLYEKYKYLWMILEERRLRGYYPANSALNREHLKFKSLRDKIRQCASDNSLKVISIKTIDVYLPQHDHIEFLLIPVMNRSSFLFQDLPETDIKDILSVVSNELLWVDTTESPITWDVYVIEPTINA